VSDSGTQTARLLAYLEEHPHGITTFEITERLRIVNQTGRISDLREHLRGTGRTVEKVREGRAFRYYLAPEEGQLALELAG